MTCESLKTNFTLLTQQNFEYKKRSRFKSYQTGIEVSKLLFTTYAAMQTRTDTNVWDQLFLKTDNQQ